LVQVLCSVQVLSQYKKLIADRPVHIKLSSVNVPHFGINK